jgi:hypothetical protein
VPIESLSVEVHAAYDVRGELGLSEDIRPGYESIKCVVSVETTASEQTVNEWLDKADRHSSWLDDLRNPVPVTRELRLTQPQAR